MWTADKATCQAAVRRRRNLTRMFSHLIWLLSQSDSSRFFQPGVFGVEGVHTIPEEEPDLHMKRTKKTYFIYHTEILIRPLGASASLLLEVEQVRSELLLDTI